MGAATEEAGRLAVAHPARKFFVLEARQRIWADSADPGPGPLPIERRERWEVRMQFGGLALRTLMPSAQEAHAEYMREVAGLDPGNSAELVKVVETVRARQGEPVDGFDAHAIPYIDRAPDGTPWRQRAAEFADVAMGNGHELVWREMQMLTVASVLSLAASATGPTTVEGLRAALVPLVEALSAIPPALVKDAAADV